MPPTDKDKCSVEGCEKYRRKKKLCTKHHYLVISKDNVCKVQKCLEEATKNGVCERHVFERVQCKTPGCTKLLLNRSTDLCQTHQYPCTVEGCVRKQKMKGLCTRHYDQVTFGRNPFAI